MLVDWFTFAAQTLNFLILVWLLKRLLYQPILDAIDARENRIAGQIADADASKREAQTQRAEFLAKNEQFDQQRTELLNQAHQEAATERSRLMEEARHDAEALRTQRREELSLELHDLRQDITKRSQSEIFAIARKVLAELAGITLETRICEVFLDRLRALDGATREQLGKALGDSFAIVQVRSAFDLLPQQRERIQQALGEILAADVQAHFSTKPDLFSGIELVVNSHKLAWGLADYLIALQNSIDELPLERLGARAR